MASDHKLAESEVAAMNQRTSSIVHASLIRQQPAQSVATVLKAGADGLLAIGLVAWPGGQICSPGY